jgi:hypothetical protein
MANPSDLITRPIPSRIGNFSLGQCIGLMGGAFVVAIAVYFVFGVM